MQVVAVSHPRHLQRLSSEQPRVGPESAGPAVYGKVWRFLKATCHHYNLCIYFWFHLPSEFYIGKFVFEVDGAAVEKYCGVDWYVYSVNRLLRGSLI